MRDDRMNLQLIDRLTRDARREVADGGVIHCNTQMALADAGVCPDSLQDRLQHELTTDH
jgi:2-polyprenyl-6-methoxyphenol hydroxylase-like FAD-dependent oxidoreductase